jgi:histone deacetylase 1/2
MGIEAHSGANGLHLTQSKYIHDILSKCSMIDCKPIASPVIPGSRLLLYDGDPFDNPSLYRSVVGSLQYLTLTRPDIAYAVNQVCKFMHRPTTVHWIAVKRILRYLKGTMNHGLHIKRAPFEALHAF